MDNLIKKINEILPTIPHDFVLLYLEYEYQIDSENIDEKFDEAIEIITNISPIKEGIFTEIGGYIFADSELLNDNLIELIIEEIDAITPDCIRNVLRVAFENYLDDNMDYLVPDSIDSIYDFEYFSWEPGIDTNTFEKGITIFKEVKETK